MTVVNAGRYAEECQLQAVLSQQAYTVWHRDSGKNWIGRCRHGINTMSTTACFLRGHMLLKRLKFHISLTRGLPQATNRHISIRIISDIANDSCLKASLDFSSSEQDRPAPSSVFASTLRDFPRSGRDGTRLSHKDVTCRRHAECRQQPQSQHLRSRHDRQQHFERRPSATPVTQSPAAVRPPG